MWVDKEEVVLSKLDGLTDLGGENLEWPSFRKVQLSTVFTVPSFILQTLYSLRLCVENDFA